MRDLVDFESLLSGEKSRAPDEAEMRESVKGLEGAKARRLGMRIWLEQQRALRSRREFPGEIWSNSRFLIGALIGVLMFLAGIGVMSGLLNRERMGFHVPMLVGVTIGLQVLILIIAAMTWVLRSRFSKGLGFVPRILGWLIGKATGRRRILWRKTWETFRLEGGKAWEALGWNLLRLTQAGAVMFSLGLMAGLLGCIWFLEVGFFWESTTPEWMMGKIWQFSTWLSLPWSWLFPEWAPTMELIGKTRWNAASKDEIFALAAGWYRFLFAAIFVWGLLPRLILWMLAVWKERAAMAALDFQAKRHRELWRGLMGTLRVDVSEPPVDGVLVLDVGGTGLKKEQLRGFLLRRLRVNPGEWIEVAVWDRKGDEAAVSSIRSGPAGVVLLAEGWALAPPRMSALREKVRSLAGANTMIYFLVSNVSSEGRPLEATEEEKKIWRDYVDSLADASAEVFFYEEEKS
ncbi:DUF2868 domain-containing protein [Luteolibacter algae]|uniref:DUF2868 domain-containing protein n=1 Tax=Luteolibacter algae TaxID=454151 RepID=UPI0036D9EB84